MRELMYLHCSEAVSVINLNKHILWGEHWDVAPYCWHLYDASIGKHVSNEVSRATGPLVSGHAFSAEQRVVSKMLKESGCFHDTNFSSVFERRLSVIFPILHDSPCTEIELSKAFSNLAKCKPFVQTAALKTFFNSWTTSSRMHADICLPCLFGCAGAIDSLSHYLRCPRLWKPVSETRDVTACSWRDTLGFTNGRSDFINLARIFYVYNCVQHGDSREVLASALSSDVRRQNVIASLYKASAFSVA
jgi:hypothetical protein